MKQLRFHAMRHLKPPIPTIRSEQVAKRIAERIVAEVNQDDFYWVPEEIEDRIWDVQREIMRCGKPATVFSRLYRQQPPVNCKGERGGHPYGWEGIDEHCREIADEIAEEELKSAVKEYKRRYE